MPYGWATYDYRGEEDLKHFKCFILAKAWNYPAWRPLFCHLWNTISTYAQQHAMEKVQTPTSKGIVGAMYKGYHYLSIIIPDEDEIKAREPVFQEKMKPIIDDVWSYWKKFKEDLIKKYEYYIPKVERLSEMSDIDVFEFWREVFETLLREVWEIHLDAFYTLNFGMIFFNRAWQKYTGLGMNDPRYAKVLSGFQSSVTDCNARLFNLSNMAKELKLEDTLNLPDTEVLSAMQKSESGKKWAEEFNDFLNVYGYRMQRMMEYCTPTWKEKPELAISEIKRTMKAGSSYNPVETTKRLRQEGELIEKELLEKIKSDEDRNTFKRLLHFAQGQCWINEDHTEYCEFRAHSIGRLVSIELGRRMVKNDQLDDPEDITYLLPDQVVWGGIVGNKHDLRPLVKRNKAEHDGYLALGEPPNDEIPMFLGDPSYLSTLAACDGAINIVLGERIADPDEVGATCVGAAGAPGVIEGTARVVFSDNDWDRIQPGDILVAPMANSTWAPLFSIVSGVVTDAGGFLAHAAIVARELNIPCVVGTVDSTAKIKDGDRIRVDGDQLYVYVLDK